MNIIEKIKSSKLIKMILVIATTVALAYAASRILGLNLTFAIYTAIGFISYLVCLLLDNKNEIIEYEIRTSFFYSFFSIFKIAVLLAISLSLNLFVQEPKDQMVIEIQNFVEIFGLTILFFHPFFYILNMDLTYHAKFFSLSYLENILYAVTMFVMLNYFIGSEGDAIKEFFINNQSVSISFLIALFLSGKIYNLTLKNSVHRNSRSFHYEEKSTFGYAQCKPAKEHKEKE